MIAQIAQFPHGRTFAVTFVDDTDFSTRANTEPVYDFLERHGVLGTKTVWPLRATRSSSFQVERERAVAGLQDGATLEEPEYRDFALSLADRGYEIALHCVASGNSPREEILKGLERFRAVFGRDPLLNAFHKTNIENLYCGRDKLDSWLLRVLERLVDGSVYQGHIEGSPYFWGDIVRATFRYVRLPFHTLGAVNTLKHNPSMPFHDERRPYVRRWFAASDGADVARFNRLLSERNVNRLEQENGACVVYTHLAKGFVRKTSAGLQLDSGFVGTVERLAQLRTVWMPTTSVLLDWLDALRHIEARHDGLNLVVRNGSERAVDGITVSLRGNLGPVGGEAIVLPSLSPGQSTSVLVGPTVTIQQPKRPAATITRRERRGIEYANYASLARAWLASR